MENICEDNGSKDIRADLIATLYDQWDIFARYAKSKMGEPRGDASEEDILQIAAFFLSKSTNLPTDLDSERYTAYLKTVISNVVLDRKKYLNAQKRGGSRGDTQVRKYTRIDLSSITTSPDSLVELCDVIRTRITDPKLLRLLEMKIHGWTTDEIAQDKNCSERTILRRICQIHEKLSELQS